MSDPKTQHDTILKLLTEKSVMKQDVYTHTIEVFNDLKLVLKEKADDFSREISKVDKRINISYKETSIQSMQLKVAGDTLDFEMHSNVFDFDRKHPMYKTKYIRDNKFNTYCGIISIYNFLADSFKYNRVNDVGYLIARLFVNREKRFFIETRMPVGYQYNKFGDVISKESLAEIVNELIIFSVAFDLYAPPYDAVSQVTVAEMLEKSSAASLRTGKRLGYMSSSESGPGFDDMLNL